jgi:hypothetical protein
MHPDEWADSATDKMVDSLNSETEEDPPQT